MSTTIETKDRTDIHINQAIQIGRSGVQIDITLSYIDLSTDIVTKGTRKIQWIRRACLKITAIGKASR